MYDPASPASVLVQRPGFSLLFVKACVILLDAGLDSVPGNGKEVRFPCPKCTALFWRSQQVWLPTTSASGLTVTAKTSKHKKDPGEWQLSGVFPVDEMYSFFTKSLLYGSSISQLRRVRKSYLQDPFPSLIAYKNPAVQTDCGISFC